MDKKHWEHLQESKSVVLEGWPQGKKIRKLEGKASAHCGQHWERRGWNQNQC